MTLRYAGIYGDKHTTLVLNSGVSEDVTLAATEEFVDLQAAQVLLEAGENTIDIVSNWGWYLIDSITLTPTPARGPHSIGDSLVNANADSNAKALYAYLKSKYGKNILSGQQGNTWVTWVTENVGKTPAVIGLDFMDYSPSRVERGTTGTDTDNALAFDKKGGIVTFAWHWNAPTGLYDTDENPWWSGFYTRATDFNIATALADTTNANYTLLIRDIDAIAEQLKILQDANVPVLFRPLHEAEGAWFWWGAQGPEPAIKLYRILYDRLTNHHSINNLVWVWNSVAADWYPGDDVVDIVSADSYTEGNGPLSSLYNQLVDLGNDTKIVAATEVGSAPLPNLLELYEAHWSWFVVWEEPYINDPEWNSLENLKTVRTLEISTQNNIMLTIL